MKNVMIDIETLGTKPYSVILSIGAIEFDINTGEIKDTFYRVISTRTSHEAGLLTDLDTIKWWLLQNDESRDKLLKGESYLILSLVDLMLFVGENKNTCVWSNSPSFDLSLIRNACERTSINVSWEFWQERDVRTISSLMPSIRKSMIFDGITHYAIDDCKHQIKYLVKILNKLK
ncbi:MULTISPECIES: 3'-5' exonuclease [unclassified Sphingobacterium]|uniref:3'-5' exonuclease n=1 Tax=unclassified Sphingobacterium TaxID=2609468 RepID=UPI0025CCA173|nr:MULTISPECIES: 3'-5' exonuclease [unclassified Sphingobacterium]